VGIPLSKEEKVDVLIRLSDSMGLKPDEILALYLVVGDSMFFLLDFLQGKTVSFPTLRSMRSAIANVGEYFIKKLSKSHYVVNGYEEFPDKIRRGDHVVISGESFEALGSPQSILGDNYILCKLKESVK
jgi:hypothetical protein